jgi:hypothetical protein
LRLLEVAENARTGTDDTARSGCAVRSIREIELVCFATEDMTVMAEYSKSQRPCNPGLLGDH